MPRRLPVRPAKIIGNFFVLFVLIVIGVIYYAFVFEIWGPRAKDYISVVVMLVLFHCLFVLLVWSFFQAMTTDPGQVPVFWGFHLGDPENKRRRYCLMCNIFKPERCHHCSACNRCVLNMDHHCPWINNCVGFWNRKFFLLLLIYVLITTYFVAIACAYDWMKSIEWALDVYYYRTSKKDSDILFRMIIIQVAYTLNGIIAILMSMFLKFHLEIALTNKTTIENLDKKGQQYKSIYDIGKNNNWQQIFGLNKWLWPFPVFCGSGKPLGDGIYWPTNTVNETEMKNKNSLMSPDGRTQQLQSSGGAAAHQGYSQLNDPKPQNLINQNDQGSRQQQNAQQQNFPTNLGAKFGGNQYAAGQQQQVQQYQQQQYYNQSVAMSDQQQNYNVSQSQNLYLHQQNQQDEQMKKQLNDQIFRNNQRAAQLNQQLNQEHNVSNQGNAYQGGQVMQKKPKNTPAPGKKTAKKR